MSVSVQNRLDYLSMVCANPSDGLSAGVWCEAANEGLMLARSLFEQVQTLLANEKDWSDQARRHCEQIAELKEQLQAALDREAGTSDALQEEIQRATENGRLAKSLHEQLETARRERDLIGTALGEPCAECGHIDWRSDGYFESLENERKGWIELAQQETAERQRVEKERDSWAKVAREYETALADRGAL